MFKILNFADFFRIPINIFIHINIKVCVLFIELLMILIRVSSSRSAVGLPTYFLF